MIYVQQYNKEQNKIIINLVSNQSIDLEFIFKQQIDRQILMYNIFQASKIKHELKRQRAKNKNEKQWLQKYSQQVQPKLIDSYNKRINTFMRKMQQQPIVLPSVSVNQDQNHIHKNVSKDGLSLYSQFRFKDHNDWNSIYTEMQRSQRKQNEKIMLQKYGDSSLAFRSIMSQSQYASTCKYQFRIRTKQREINPPMKYTFLAPQIMMRKFTDNKKMLKNKTVNEMSHQNDRNKSNQTQQVKKNVRLDEDNRSVRSFKSIKSFAQSNYSIKSKNQDLNEQENMENDEQLKKKQKKKYISQKIHFKTLIQTYEQTQDPKIKQNMRDVLIKCGVFRNKDKRAVTQMDQDGLSELQKTNNNNSTIHPSNSKLTKK